ncbi:aspartate ammonia-lyase [Mannheimia sp. AT1]|uniref:Aspartate ammonia-lyase n=1 Tax=Mannheimia cairinae TaxID=3025936 RepID=A0ABT5MQM7_9PAST|nr:aspartate ammonia-lyase [Mannheimia cairinae]MDD0824493.1 aspartate ammonia-lyase [Mannheimia cairinae]MDD0825594.1 aspartate ammonia-lyase [Mannheimia cairinae]
MTNVRIEHDLLGEREVPNDAYWGIHTLRAIENFNISNVTISDVPEFVRGMVMVKKATALANGELGAIPKKIAKAIVQACDEVLVKGRCLDQFPSDVYQGGAGTSVNMNTNEVIANLALEILGEEKGKYDIVNPMDHVNASQSTNDAYPTGFRIAVYNSIAKLIEKIAYLQTAFENKATEFADILKMGRTQLQDAVPMTVGQEFKAFSVLLEEEVRSLKYISQILLEVNLGATAIGTGLNTPEGYSELAVKYLSEVTQLPCTLSENLIEATSDCGAYVMVHGALKRTAVKLSKVCNDLRLLSSGPRAGLNEINLPELQAGSSIMPAKVNPVVPEVVNQVCFKVIGNDTTVTFAAEAGQLQLNVMEPVIGQAMFESIDLLANACVNLRDKCIDGITANREVCQDYVFNSIGIVTYLNPFIGHHNGDIVGKICATTGRSVRDVVLEKGLLTRAELDDILSVENLMNPTYKAKRFTEDE